MGGRSTSTTKLFTETAVTRDRKEFDDLLGALARAGLVTVANDTFRNGDGNEVTYRKVSITHEGRTPDDATLATVLLRGERTDAPATRGVTRKAKAVKDDGAPLTAPEEALEAKLRAWRLETAKAAGKPPFIVFGDSTLRALARAKPERLSELETVAGIGPQKLDTYGASILAVCRESLASADSNRSREDDVQPRASSQPASRNGRVAQASSRLGAGSRNDTGESRKALREPAPGIEPIEKRPAAAASAAVELTPRQAALQARLQGWRLEAAREAGLPSFFVLSDTVLREIALATPTSLVQLSAIRGLGTEKIERYGEAVVALCQEA